MTFLLVRLSLFILTFIIAFTWISSPAFVYAESAASRLRSVTASTSASASDAADLDAINSNSNSKTAIDMSSSSVEASALAKPSRQLSRLQAEVQSGIIQLEKGKVSEAASNALQNEIRSEVVSPPAESTAPSDSLEGLPIDSTRSPSSLTILPFPSSSSRLLLSYWHPITSDWDWLFYSSLDGYSNGFWIERVNYCGSALLQNNDLYSKKISEDDQPYLRRRTSENNEDDDEENEDEDESNNLIPEKQQWNVSEIYEPSTDDKEKCVVILPKVEPGKVYMLYVISWMQTSWSAWSTPMVFSS